MRAHSKNKAPRENYDRQPSGIPTDARRVRVEITSPLDSPRRARAWVALFKVQRGSRPLGPRPKERANAFTIGLFAAARFARDLNRSVEAVDCGNRKSLVSRKSWALCPICGALGEEAILAMYWGGDWELMGAGNSEDSLILCSFIALNGGQCIFS